MNKIAAKQYRRAKAEGRLCANCKWMISIKNWKKGYRLCHNCYSAMKGVNVSTGYLPPADDSDGRPQKPIRAYRQVSVSKSQLS